MSSHLQRILDLVRRTGDTMVVVEKDSDEGFVVMDLHKYEILQDSEFESDPPSELQPTTPDIWDVMSEGKNHSETWDPDNLSEDEMVNLEKQYEEFAKRNVKEAIESVAPVKTPPDLPLPRGGAQDSKKDEDFGEEQFYLEPVE